MHNLKLFSFLALIVLLVVFGPLASIWSLNTLFPALAIPYTFETWAAVILLSAAIRSNVSLKK
jgi:hypothetical protein